MRPMDLGGKGDTGRQDRSALRENPDTIGERKLFLGTSLKGSGRKVTGEDTRPEKREVKHQQPVLKGWGANESS